MARNVRARRSLPEDTDDHDQHAWLLKTSLPTPPGFADTYVVVSLLVGNVLRSLLPGMEIPMAYTAVGFGIKRDRLAYVQLDHLKRVFSHVLWQRTNESLYTTQFRLVYRPEPPLGGSIIRSEPVHVPFNISLAQLVHLFPKPRRNIGSSWPVLILGSEDQFFMDIPAILDSPYIYRAPVLTEILFLTAELNSVDQDSSMPVHPSARPPLQNAGLGHH